MFLRSWVVSMAVTGLLFLPMGRNSFCHCLCVGVCHCVVYHCAYSHYSEVEILEITFVVTTSANKLLQDLVFLDSKLCKIVTTILDSM